jgi:hypothetical protein
MTTLGKSALGFLPPNTELSNRARFGDAATLQPGCAPGLL